MPNATAFSYNPTIASMLMPGMHFTLFDKACTVVYAEPNDFGMMVVRFVMDEDNSLERNVLVVPVNTMFPVYYV